MLAVVFAMDGRDAAPNSTTLPPPSNMSTSKRPGSPFWYIQFQYNGRTYIKSSKTTDKKLATKLELQWRNELIEQQQIGFTPTLSVIEAFQSYSRTKQQLACAYYVRLWCGRAMEYWSKKDYIHEISSLEIERYHAYLVKVGYQPQTIVHALSQVAGAIKYAKKMGYKVQEFELPYIKLPRGRLRYLSVEEEQRLLAVLEPTTSPKWQSEFTAPEIRQEMQDLYDIVIMLIDTGARHTEITTLRWNCVNIDDGSIKLWRSKVQNESVLYMSHRVKAVLTRRKETAKGDYIFMGPDGGPRKYNSTPFRRAFDRAGLQGCTAHTLRHTHATRLIQNGLNLYEVKEILGHSNIVTTMRYAHLEQAQVSRKAVDVINQLQQSQN